MQYKHLFGPVPSRRLGRSLGVDLVPHKLCTLDCVYCECGRTTRCTMVRKEYVPTVSVIAELEHYLSTQPHLDFITFSGSGEPTLHSGLGVIIEYIKSTFPQYKIALLTNATLFDTEEVRRSVLRADVIVPSVDAVSDRTFKEINHPNRKLKVSALITGLIRLRKEFAGKLWLEIFIIPGINDTEKELSLLKKAIGKIRPNKIQINTLDRPGTRAWVQPADVATLLRIQKYFGRKAEIISKQIASKKIPHAIAGIKKNILATIKRRPCTADDLSQSIGIDIPRIKRYLRLFVKQNKITSKHLPRGVFYMIQGDLH